MRFDHIVLNITDMEGMIGFYRDILLCSIERLAEYQNGDAPFPIARISEDNIIDLFPKELWLGTDNTKYKNNNMNHYCLVMTEGEWKELNERLSENNIIIEEGPVQRGGAQGMGTSIYFRDPDHNLIEARYY